MSWRVMVLGRMGWTTSPHPRAGALSCPSPAICGPELGHLSRPALCRRAGLLRGPGAIRVPGEPKVLYARPRSARRLLPYVHYGEAPVRTAEGGRVRPHQTVSEMAEEVLEGGRRRWPTKPGKRSRVLCRS